MDLCTKLLLDIHDEAKKHRVAQMEAHRVFFDAYEKHKKSHGSFKGVDNYNKKMNERYRFMHDEAIKYIEAHRKR